MGRHMSIRNDRAAPFQVQIRACLAQRAQQAAADLDRITARAERDVDSVHARRMAGSTQCVKLLAGSRGGDVRRDVPSPVQILLLLVSHAIILGP